MEISRKKITNEAIHEKEKALMESVTSAVAEYEAKFASIGYVLETEFARDNDANGLTPEEREEIRNSKIDENEGVYENGYISNAKITVKREKTAEDIAADEAADAGVVTTDEVLSEEELELRRNELVLEKAKREQARAAAFTTVLFVRVYKAFWKETVSISDSADEIRQDLEEFYTVLAEKAQASEE